jgi:ABC-type lipoprotein release transport system permease subunit
MRVSSLRPSGKLGLFGYAAAAVWRRRAKAFALGGGLVFAVALVAAVLFLTDALRAEAERARLALPDILVQRLVAGRPTTIRASDAEALRDIPSVADVRPRVWGYLFLPALQGNVTIVGIAPGGEAAYGLAPAVVPGGARGLGEHGMVMGHGLAGYLGLAVGDTLGLPTSNRDAPPLTLEGTFVSEVDLFTSDVIVCSEEDARAILLVPEGEATDLAITVRNPAEARVVARTVLTRLPGARVVERDLLGRVYALAYGRRAGIVLAAAIPALLALLVLAWDRASGLGPEERREIAILKAVGWSTSDVLWAKLFESLVVGILATVAGLVLAYAWVFWLGAPGLRPTLVGWSVLYPESPLTPMVDAAQLLAIALAVLAPFVGLSIVPAWRAASLDPMEAMRG